MMNFDSYYQPPEDRAWDYYVDYCDSNGIEPTGDGFEEWEEVQRDMADDAAIERAEAAAEDFDAWERDPW